jgi:hypothetical protein
MAGGIAPPRLTWPPPAERALPVWLALALLLAGCGGGNGAPQTMRVWGDVTYDGKPIEDGSITFTPVENTPGGSSGGAVKAGKYDLSAEAGPVAGGKYRVEISALRPVGKPVANPFEAGGPPLQQSENYIPAQYNRSSTLTATISDTSSKNAFNFPLEKGAPSRKPASR